MTAAAIATTVFAAVLLAELAGDRSLYTIALLSARFGIRAVLIGAAPAYALKTAAAVLAANAVARLPHPLIAAVSCATCVLAAWTVWRRENERADAGATARLSRPSLVAFASVAFTEWGDPGQLATALMAVRFHAAFIVWSSATAALLTKSIAATVVGLTARRYLDLRWLRVAAAAVCIVSAAFSASELFRT